MITQMNVRIDEELKRSGDAVFMEAGLTPSEVVRSVWEYAAQHGEAPAIVTRALAKGADDVLALAKEAGYELSEEELNAVNGGIDTDWACFDVHTHPCDPVKCYSFTPFLP